jgi:putative transposase
VTDKYELIDAEKANYPITRMCGWLTVSRAGFYAWRDRAPTLAARRRSRLGSLVEAAFAASRGTYGGRRLAEVLRRSGETVSVRLVAELMAERGLVACQPRPFRITTQADPVAAARPDLVGRDFTATQIGTKLVGDITYIRTWTGWLYLATVIDCATRKVIGWSMAEHMRTSLVVDALSMAAGRVPLAKSAIFHSDRGTQYTSALFTAALRQHELRASVGRTGICWDNALAESFFGALKNELVYRTAFPTPSHARRAIAEYIEVFYNRQRLHSALGYRTPAEVEAEHHNLRLAAREPQVNKHKALQDLSART